ncbi:MAG TPA: hypothetical protein VF937_03525 [Chloroflexota bacterium]
MATIEQPRRSTLDHQLERTSWALFLIMIGGLLLLPAVPSGTWLIGTGLIMLGLNLARRMNDLPVSNFTIVLGIGAIALGISEFVGSELPVFPLLLILIGASILWRTFVVREHAT